MRQLFREDQLRILAYGYSACVCVNPKHQELTACAKQSKHTHPTIAAFFGEIDGTDLRLCSITVS